MPPCRRRETSSGCRANGWGPRGSSRSGRRLDQPRKSAASLFGKRLPVPFRTSGVKSQRCSKTSLRREQSRMSPRPLRRCRSQARPTLPAQSPRRTPAPKSQGTIPHRSQHRGNARRRGGSDGKRCCRATGKLAWSPWRFWFSAPSPWLSCSPRKAHGRQRESAHGRAAPNPSEVHSQEPSPLPRQASRARRPTSPASLGTSPSSVGAPAHQQGAAKPTPPTAADSAPATAGNGTSQPVGGGSSPPPTESATPTQSQYSPPAEPAQQTYTPAQHSAPAPEPPHVSPSGALTCISNCG